MTEQTQNSDAEAEGRATIKIMQDSLKSFGLSDAAANEKINALAAHVQESGGSFRLIRIRDVVYTVQVSGVRQVELHAMPGGKSKQDDKYRIKKMQNTLPNILAILKEFGVQTVYVPMEKKDAKPYTKMMEEFGFKALDIPEDVGAKDMVAYVTRIQ